MSETNKIIEELTGALTSNTAELNALKGQVASQQDLLNEVRTHNQNVAKSVDWGNLGEDVFKGVASATTSKIEEATHMSREFSQNAGLLTDAGKKQLELAKSLSSGIRDLNEKNRQIGEALESLRRGLKGVSGAVGAKLTHMLLTGALTASVGLFGGYWWAKGNIEKMSFVELGEDITGPYGADYCGYASGEMKTDHRGGTACFFWVTPNPVEPTE